jgi:hypothetical protein
MIKMRIGFTGQGIDANGIAIYSFILTDVPGG